MQAVMSKTQEHKEEMIRMNHLLEAKRSEMDAVSAPLLSMSTEARGLPTGVCGAVCWRISPIRRRLQDSDHSSQNAGGGGTQKTVG